MSESSQVESTPVQFPRSEGRNQSERFLKRLCDGTFLSLWSYSNLFRDQKTTGQFDADQAKGDGKELCDLLVVFENHIIIFSDKQCDFPDSGNLSRDWSRWYRRAIRKSAKQIFGAERWVREHPGRIFLDSVCTTPLPIDLPDLGSAKVHRVVVAHGVSEKCQEFFGDDSGSLLVAPWLVGDSHYAVIDSDQGILFSVGVVDASKGYVHVWNDHVAGLVLDELDTISDLVAYLEKKEELVATGSLVCAAGEEELLGYYLQHFDDDGSKTFGLPGNDAALVIDGGFWHSYLNHPQRSARDEENRISYAWDHLIESFCYHLREGTQHYTTGEPLAVHETGLRFLARENRFRRRILARRLYNMIETTPADSRRTVVFEPITDGDPHYVFLLLPHYPSVPYERYRETRREVLNACCMVTKRLYPEAENIIGIATETGQSETRSEDFVFLDASHWNSDLDAEAARFQAEHGLLTSIQRIEWRAQEYPDVGPEMRNLSQEANVRLPKGRDRNKPCACGSGVKYKFCCGRPNSD